MSTQSEDSTQISFMNWCNWIAKFHYSRFELIHHIPNGGKRNAREARKLKMMGVTKGILDIFCPFIQINKIKGKITKDSVFGGLYIEFKSEKGRLSEDQEYVITQLQDEGYKVVVCRTKQEAIAEVEKYLGMELPRREQDKVEVSR